MATLDVRPAQPARLGTFRRARLLLIVTAYAAVVVCGLSMASLVGSGALFIDDRVIEAGITAGRIFPGERDTPAFAVTDSSSGAAVDASNQLAFGGDGRYLLTGTWPTAYGADRFLDVRLNAPLPAGLTVDGAAVTLRITSSAGTGACVYAELRQASTGAVMSTHGDQSSSLGCTVGSSPLVITESMPAIDTTDSANDLSVRIYARDGSAGSMQIDQLTVAGSTPYASFTLYPVSVSDVAGGEQTVTRWGPAGP